MSDENEEVIIEEDATTQESVEVKDAPRGYKSYDEWVKDGKDPEEYKGKKAYEKEGERFEALMRTQRELKDVKDLTAKMWEQQQRIEEAAYKKAYKDLQDQMVSAAEIADVETVKRTTDQLAELAANKPDNKPYVAKQRSPDEIFAEKNPWFVNPQTREDHIRIAETKYEDQQLGKELHDQGFKIGVDISIEQYMERLSDRMNKLKAPSVNKQPIISQAVHDSSASPSDARIWTNQIPAAHKKIIKVIESSTGKQFTLAETKAYVNRLKLTGEIK